MISGAVTPSLINATATFLGCSVGIEFYGNDDTNLPEHGQNVYNAWMEMAEEYLISDPEYVGFSAWAYVYRIFATSPPVGGVWETDDEFVVCGIVNPSYKMGDPEPDPIWLGETQIERNCSFSFSGVKAMGNVGTQQYNWRESPRRWLDQYVSYKWISDGNTYVSCQIGDLGASGYLPLGEEEELDLGPAVANVAMSIAMHRGDVAGASYATFSELSVSDDDVNISVPTFYEYSFGGATPTWTRTPGSNDNWVAEISTQSYTVKTIGGLNQTPTGHGIWTHVVGPVKYHINSHRYGPNTGVEYSPEPQFDVGLRYHVDEENVSTVWLSPNMTHGPFTKVELVTAVGPGPQTGLFSINDPYIRVRGEWYEDEDNHEFHEIEDETGTKIVTQNDMDGYIVVAPIDVDSLDSDSGNYLINGLTLEFKNVKIDIPDDCPDRPTYWYPMAYGEGDIVSASFHPEDNGVFFVGNGYYNEEGVLVKSEEPFVIKNPTITRDLDHVKYDRFNFMASKSPSGKLNPDWPIMLQANKNREDDHDEWLAEVPYEDVIQWPHRYLRIKFDKMPELADKKTIVLKLHYSQVSFSDPNYTCHEHRFGECGEWEWSRTQTSFEFKGKLEKKGEGGEAIIDLAQLIRNKITKLNFVDKVTIVLPSVEGEYIFPSNGTGLECIKTKTGDEPEVLINAAIDPWNWTKNFVGFHFFTEGMMGFNLEYGYEQYEDGMRGLKGTQYRQPCPSSSVTKDFSYAKIVKRLVNELSWQEGVIVDWLDDDVKEKTVDKKQRQLCEFYWWDLARGNGLYSLDGTIKLHKKVRNQVGLGHLPFHTQLINGEYQTQGIVTGLVYDDKYQVQEETEGLKIILWGKDTKNNTPWKQVSEINIGPNGFFNSLPAPTKDIIYALGAEDQIVRILGNFYNREVINSFFFYIKSVLDKTSIFKKQYLIIVAADIDKRIHVFRSQDNGKTFPEAIQLHTHSPSFFNSEPNELFTNNGIFLLDDYGITAQEEIVHMTIDGDYPSLFNRGSKVFLLYIKDGNLYCSVSFDKGKTFGVTEILIDSNVKEHHYPSGIFLDDGTILVAYQGSDSSIKTKFSYDGGRSWQVEEGE